MSRSTQFIGMKFDGPYSESRILGSLFDQKIVGTRTVIETYHNGREETSTSPIYDNYPKTHHDHPEAKIYSGMMYEEDGKLKVYELRDGTLLFEVQQIVVCLSSGPMIFTALQNEAGKWLRESLWTFEDVESVEDGLVDEDFFVEEIENSTSFEEMFPGKKLTKFEPVGEDYK